MLRPPCLLIAGPEPALPSPAEPALGLVAALLAALAAVACVAAWRRLRGTTLAAPAIWAAASLAVVALTELALVTCDNELTASVWRFAAAAGTFCPPMAVLGAKRPQDRGWQWIVASLWVIVALPGIPAWLTPAGDRLELSPLWTGFLVVVAGYSTALNYGPTRFAWPAVLYFAGQAALVAPATKWRSAMPGSDALWVAIGALLLLTAWLAARARAGRLPERFGDDTAPAAQTPLARWRAFRDAFGLSWGLRVLHRVNETAEVAAWPVRLAWDGFVPANASPGGSSTGQAPPEELTPEVHAAMNAILRRFERLDEAAA